MTQIERSRKLATHCARIGRHQPDRFTTVKHTDGIDSGRWFSRCKDCNAFTYLVFDDGPTAPPTFYGSMYKVPCQANFARAELDNLFGVPATA